MHRLLPYFIELDKMDLNSYRNHVDLVVHEWQQILAATEHDAVLVAAGENPLYFDDDQNPPFHANPHFLRFVPESNCCYAALLLTQEKPPTVYWYTPSDYWYLPSSAPEWVNEVFEVKTFDDYHVLWYELRQIYESFSAPVYCGPNAPTLNWLTLYAGRDTEFETAVQYSRAYKTDFELACMAQATRRGVHGHAAAANAFRNDGSEFDINMAFLQASQQDEIDMPYPSIVGLNEHAATLHYQHHDSIKPNSHRSLLIDAGAKAHCYHSDITRTYSRQANDEFAQLIQHVDDAQQQAVQSIRLGEDYIALHERMHRLICDVLEQSKLVRCSPQSAYEQQLSDIFFPHGTGHLLGLQTHDVGGKLISASGATRPSPERFPSLRLTRTIEERMVFTVEPGIYFIPVLLNTIAGHKDVNWERVEAMLPYGGVRVEDNVYLLDGETHNLTRPAFADLATDS